MLNVAEAESPTIVTVEQEQQPSCEIFIQEIKAYDWNDQIAYAIMMSESGCRDYIVNNNPNTGDYSVGLFQINIIGTLGNDRPSEEWLKNYKNNIAYAYSLYKSQGWDPWSAYKNGNYKKYLLGTI